MLNKECFLQKIYKILNLIGNYSYIKAKKNISKTDQEKEKIVYHINSTLKENKDNLPIGMRLFSTYKNETHSCIVATDGNYTVNKKSYNSLSEAAKAVTRVRTEGWRFWKIYKNGPSILEAFRRNNV